MTPREILINIVMEQKSCSAEKALVFWGKVFEHSPLFVNLCSWSKLSKEIGPYYPGKISYYTCQKACHADWDSDDETKTLLQFLQEHLYELGKEIKMEDFL